MAEPPRALPTDPAFRADQRIIALFVAQLDDQSRRLRAATKTLDVAALEWRPGPGRNSVGMLLAHIALTEVFWSSVASGTVATWDDAEAAARAAVGMGLDDDGMPALVEDVGQPAALAGWDRARYLDLLDHARQHTRSVVSAWTDADLATVVVYRDRGCTRDWILYHLLEHLAAHAGQVGLVIALRTPPAA